MSRRTRYREAGRRKGFTLVELTISSAVAVGILGASYLCLRAGLRTQGGVERRAELAQTARVVLGHITADLRSAWKLSKELDFVGIDSMDGKTETDRLLFGSRHWKPSRAGEGDFCEISYSLRKPRGSDKFQLIRERTPFPDENPFDGGEPAVLAGDVHGLHFEYYDGLYWYEKWGRVPGVQLDTTEDLLAGNTSGLPDAVRIVLSFQDPEPPDAAKSEGSAERDSFVSPADSLADGDFPPEQVDQERTASTAVALPYAFQAVVALNLAPRAAKVRTSTGTYGSTDSTETTDSQSSSGSSDSGAQMRRN